jgi:division protein CdvB (Snf7/Vps24/ESCRT-III family)
MPLAANSPADRVEQLIVLTERLSGLMDRESDLLKTRRSHEITDFQDERAQLSTIYTQEMELIKRNKSLVSGVTPELMNQLKEITASFQSALDNHGRILTTIKSVTENMVQAVAKDVDEKNNHQVAYGETGKLQKNKHTRPTSFGVHQVI